MKTGKRVLQGGLLICAVLLTLGCPGTIPGTWSGGKVTGLTATQGTDPYKITLNWTAFPDASMYVVYAARTINGDYQQVSWGVPTNTIDIYLDGNYGYYYELNPGCHYWFRVHAMVSTDYGLNYSGMSDAAEGWGSEDIHNGTWEFKSESKTSTGGTETVISGSRHRLIIDDTAKTIQYTEEQYNTVTSAYETFSGAEFSYDSVLFADDYTRTISFINLRQTKYWSGTASAFEALTTMQYTEQTGGHMTPVEISVLLDREYKEMELRSTLYYDSSNSGSPEDYIDSYTGFIQLIPSTE